MRFVKLQVKLTKRKIFIISCNLTILELPVPTFKLTLTIFSRQKWNTPNFAACLRKLPFQVDNYRTRKRYFASCVIIHCPARTETAPALSVGNFHYITIASLLQYIHHFLSCLFIRGIETLGIWNYLFIKTIPVVQTCKINVLQKDFNSLSKDVFVYQ